MTTSSPFTWESLFPQPNPHQDSDFLNQIPTIPGLQEALRDILMVRQVHALEHATVWVLSGTPKSSAFRTVTQDDDRWGGLSTHQGFYLFGEVETERLTHAVHKALHRLMAGEWHLAVHPRCGTNLAVKLTLSAGLAAGGHFILPKDPISQFLGLGTALTLSNQLTPAIGDWLQSHVTTSIPFNLTLQSVQRVNQIAGQLTEGQPAHFVRLAWRDMA
jgi:hypothetical protein